MDSSPPSSSVPSGAPVSPPVVKLPESKVASDEQIREVLASALFGANSAVPSWGANEFRESWQALPETRKRYRDMARALLAALSDAGVTIRASDSKKVLKCLEFLQTVPARAAYTDLDEEPTPSVDLDEQPAPPEDPSNV